MAQRASAEEEERICLSGSVLLDSLAAAGQAAAQAQAQACFRVHALNPRPCSPDCALFQSPRRSTLDSIAQAAMSSCSCQAKT